MSLIERLGRHSAVYTVATILQRGTAFVLVPLYTRVFTPAQYGTVAIVTAINGLLIVILPLSLYGAITRFYFEHRHEPERLREFWSTVLLAMAVCCGVLATVLLTIARPLVERVVPDVPFWPYVAIGVGTSTLQPFLQVALGVFQSREQPIRYAAISLGHFLVSLSLTLVLVLWSDWGAAGPLFALMASSALFAAIGLFMLRDDFAFVFRWDDLKAALAYVVPQIPHGLAAQALNTTDKFFLNAFVGLSAAGIYNIAGLFSLVVDMVAQSINRAYVPASLGILKADDPEQLKQLRDAGATLVVFFCLVGAGLTIFSNEIVAVIASKRFAGASRYVPFLAFAGTASGIYYVLVNILFYDRSATRFIPVGTIAGGAVSIALNYVLIRAIGPLGAAIATLLAQLFTTALIGVIGYRFERVRWNYSQFGVSYLLSFAVATTLSMYSPFGTIGNFVMRAAGWTALAAALNYLVWRNFFHLPHLAMRMVRPALGGRSS